MSTFNIAASDDEIRKQFANMSRTTLIDNLVAAAAFARELLVENEKLKLLAATLLAQAELPVERSKDGEGSHRNRIDVNIKVSPESSGIEEFEVKEHSEGGRIKRWTKTVRPATGTGDAVAHGATITSHASTASDSK